MEIISFSNDLLDFFTAMEDCVENPGHLMVLLNRMLNLPPHELWPLAGPLVSSIKCLLNDNVPRKILGKSLYLTSNSIMMKLFFQTLTDWFGFG